MGGSVKGTKYMAKGGSMMQKSKGGSVMSKSKGGSVIAGNANRRRADQKLISATSYK